VQPATIRASASQLDDNGVELSSVAIIQNWASPTTAFDPRPWSNGDAPSTARPAARLLPCKQRASRRPKSETNCHGRPGFARSKELADDIEAGGFTLSVEPHPLTSKERARPTIELIREAGRPWLRYLHCTAHTFLLAASTSEALREAGDLVDHIHLADSLRPER